MPRLWAGLFSVFVLISLAPAPLSGQSGRSCRQVLPSDFRRIVNTRGQEIVYFRDPVRFLCTGDVLLESDSAVVNRSASTVELIGAVVYRDSTRELRSDWANYLGRMEQLLTRGSTVVQDLEGGALVEGDQLNYLRQTADRPLARMVVTGGRPHALLPPQRPAGSDRQRAPNLGLEAAPDLPDAGPDRAPDRAPDGVSDGTAEPAAGTDEDALFTEVWADRIELEGEDLFRAEGDVDLVRGAMTGGGESALFDRAAGRMTLTRTAFVENDDYRLEGDRIIAFLEGEGLREVLSEGSARVRSEELNVRAARVRIAFSDGQVERLEAWNPAADPPAPRARADARDFHLRADSIDVLADSAGVRELRAVGRSYGERGEVGAAPTGGTATPAALSRDWIQGDTILGFFSRVEVAADSADPANAGDPADLAATDAADPDAAESEVALERIEVVGGSAPALSLYRQEAEGEGLPTINFMKARRIILFMEQGDVARVEAEGPLEGVYLDPGGQPAGGDGAPGEIGMEDERR